MKKNKFSKALNHLKSKKLDEKIKKLEESAPTNNMSGIYQQSPRADAAFRLGELDPPRRFVAAADGSWPAGIPGTAGEPYYDRPAGYFNGTVDWETVTSPEFGYDSAQGNSTDGLIDPVTNVVKTQLPPNSRSFILGPLVDGFVPNHISDAFTRIGYIEKDTRQFVLLASFTGEWIAGLNGYNGVPTWNGTSTGFTQVNPNFTLDMALWFRNEMLKGRYVKNVSYNAVGGIPQPQFSDPDAPQPLGGNGVGGGSGAAGDNPDGTGTGVGSGGEPNAGTPQGDPDPGKDPGQNDLWGMSGRRRRKNRRGSGARGNRGRKKPAPTPSPTPAPQGGRGGGQGNPTNPRGTGARPTPSPTPTPRSTSRPTPTPITTPKPDTQRDYQRNRANRPDMKGGITTDQIADTIARGGAIAADPVDFLTKAGVLSFLELGNIINKAFGSDKSQGTVNAFKHMWQHHNNNNPLHPNFRKHDPSSPNYEGPADVPWDDKTSKEVTKNLDNALSKLNGGKGPRNPNGKLEPDEINQISQEMKNNYESGSRSSADSSYYNSIGSLPPGETNFYVKNGKFDSFDTNYQFTDPRDANPIAFDDNFNDAAITNFVSGFLTGIGRQATTAGKPKGDGGRPYRAKSVDEFGRGSDNPVIGTQYNTQTRFTRKESYIPSSGDKRRILREIKQPLREIKQLPKTEKLKGYRPNFKGKYSPQNTPDVTASKKSDRLVMAKNAE